MKKRLIGSILCLVLVLTGFPYWEINKTEAAVVSGTTINENVRQAAAEFLSQYVSLFATIGYIQDSGNAWVDGESLPPEQWPELFFGRRDFYYYMGTWDKSFTIIDRHGSLVDEYPFILDGLFIAVSFSLYDINNDGIPVIFIQYEGPGVMTTPHKLAVGQFIGGQYQKTVLNLPNYDMGSGGFYFDTMGNLVLRTDQFYADSAFVNYYFVNFIDGIVEVELFLEYYYAYYRGGGTGINHITGNEFTFELDINLILERPKGMSLTIPGMPDVLLTSVEPMTGLENSLRASITQRLLEDSRHESIRIALPDEVERILFEHLSQHQYSSAFHVVGTRELREDGSAVIRK